MWKTDPKTNQTRNFVIGVIVSLGLFLIATWSFLQLTDKSGAGPVIAIPAAMFATYNLVFIVYPKIRSLWLQTTWDRKYVLQTLSSFNPQNDVDYFSDRLGRPSYEYVFEKGERQHIYISSYYIIAVYSNQYGKVTMHTVTTTDRNFNPTIPFDFIAYPKKKKAQLGKTKFSELSEHTRPLTSSGARGFWYGENFYFGRPGAYLGYVVAFDPLGVGPIGDWLELESALSFKDIADSAEIEAVVNTFRSETVINSYTIAESMVDDGVGVGVPIDMIHVGDSRRGKPPVPRF